MGDYSVATKNRFQLSMLDNSDDEDVDLFEILKQEEAKQEKKKPEEVVTKKNAKSRSDKNTKPKKVPQQQVQNKQVDDANTANIQKSGSANRTARGNDNKPPRMRQNDYRNKGEDFEKPPQDQQVFGGRGRARGGSAGGRGGRGGRGGGGGGFRRYDRHSGSDKTGIKPTEKKEGSGGHNWGDEISAQLDSGEAADTQKSASAGEERTEGDGQADETINEENNEPAEPAEPAEPEVVEMTLDEWKASQSGTRVKQKFNVRRAGEGEDQSQWKKTVALETRKRTESTEDESYEEEHDDNKLEGTRSALDKLNIEIRFATEESPRGGGGGMGGRGGRGRGGRGGDRGGGFRGDRGGGPRNDRRGGRGGFRGGFRGNNRFSAGESAPRVDNVNEFPSLGSK